MRKDVRWTNKVAECRMNDNFTETVKETRGPDACEVMITYATERDTLLIDIIAPPEFLRPFVEVETLVLPVWTLKKTFNYLECPS